MKAQRRHELKTNTLAEAMSHLPQTRWRSVVSGALTIIGAALVGLLIRYRLSAGQERVQRAHDNLAVVLEDINQMKQMQAQLADPSQPGELFVDINSRLDAVLSDAGGDPQMAAEAMIARGDANWIMSAVASSTTQPSQNQQTPEGLLATAESAYQQVITAYPEQHFSVCSAHFGLAAIDENRHDWAKARQEYQAIIDDAQAGDVTQALAKSRLSSVDQLEHPPVIVAATPPPPTVPATTAPSAGASLDQAPLITLPPDTLTPAALPPATQPAANK
jgi:hypothetical protein